MTFIDLFAGIGGFRQGLTSVGAECLFSCEVDKHAQTSYQANYHEEPFGDIQTLNPQLVPKTDILCAGFPCQPFSIAGVSKKNSLGRKHGFEDEKQGTLFFDIMRIVQAKRPKVLFLENVKNLKSHNKGHTWQVIYQTLLDHNYTVFDKIIDAQYYVPQHRERIYIVAFDNEQLPNINFQFPTYPSKRLFELTDILETEVDAKYTLSNNLWVYLQKHKENSAKKGKGFGFGLVDPKTDTVTRTMSARYYKDGSEILIAQQGKNPRRLTPTEARKLFGYPDSFILPLSDTQAYKRFGNTVVVPVIEAIAGQIKKTLTQYNQGKARLLQPIFMELNYA